MVHDPAAPNAPGPRGWPLFGSLFDIARDPLGFYASLPPRFGDVSRLRVGSEVVWVFVHPDAIEQVLVEHREKLHKDRLTASLSRIVGQGLLTSEDPLWRKQRKIAAPAFQPRQLAVYAGVMAEEAEKGLAGLPEGLVEVHEVMNDVTREIVLRTLFGASGGDGEAVVTAIESFMGAFEHELRSVERLFPPWVPTPGRRTMAATRQTVLRVLSEVIEARKRGAEGDDLLWRLLQARDEDGQPMPDERLRDEAITLFIAGHETTALALSYALWLLADAPEAQERVRAEVVAAAGAGRLGLEHRQALPFTSAVVQEALRLYPPAYIVGRTPIEDVEIAGRLVRRGEVVLLPIYVVHRDARWFPEPDAFRPERWLGDAAKGLPKYAYFPFGGGARVCIGNHFALMEAVLALGTIVRARTFARPPGATLALQPAVTMRPQYGVTLQVGTSAQR